VVTGFAEIQTLTPFQGLTRSLVTGAKTVKWEKQSQEALGGDKKKTFSTHL
jgi:hypothetical protein